MDASYEVLGHDSNSEGTVSGREMGDHINREGAPQELEE
jgi:autophagy-related protein 33